MRTPGLTIILVEDDDGHAALIRRNLERSRLDARVIRARDGVEALEILSAAPPLNETGRMLMLLDISMPKMDGMEVLRRMRSDPATSRVPVYMLSTTDNPAEIDRCFDLGCNVYLNKPVAYDAFTACIRRLCEFLEVSYLPTLPAARQNVSA